ncbi:pseudouridylate synthase RPUSD4, mitochondrial [Nomia melanderi]|uniref:pseudouridylate synthase RPUSD4, mitochondrial n=1 Tax=Nomia melanderi TaxID=2448451 RepID=UPI00130408A9|nr:mitochondrial RNA pseudouridine synthase Rpusd4-like [Nomia melanderi]
MEMLVFKHVCTQTLKINSIFVKLFKRNYVQAVLQSTSKNLHPYQQIHPWKSLDEFSEELVNNVIYNKDGLVAINKPYGISVDRVNVQKVVHRIANNVKYTIYDALPHIAKQLNFSGLTIIRKPEKYMTGIMLLAANPTVIRKVNHALGRNTNAKTYWVITTAIPNQTEGTERLQMERLSKSKKDQSTRIEMKQRTSKNAFKKDNVKVLNVSFKVLSTSKSTSSSLVEITSTTNKDHAVRLFASTFLYSPVLGDNLMGSRVRKVGNTYIKVDPSVKLSYLPPKLDKQVYRLLGLRESQQEIIPVHIHLRSITLLSYLKNKETLTINAPIIPPFDWAYKQFHFQDSMENK